MKILLISPFIKRILNQKLKGIFKISFLPQKKTGQNIVLSMYPIATLAEMVDIPLHQRRFSLRITKNQLIFLTQEKYRMLKLAEEEDFEEKISYQ